jgi:hypothetical protein
MSDVRRRTSPAIATGVPRDGCGKRPDDGITGTTVTDDGNQQERQTTKEQSIDE